jgi:hypothetical protein
VDDMSEDELIAAARREWCETPPYASQESALADCPPAVVAALLDLLEQTLAPNPMWNRIGKALAAIREALR